MSHDRVTVTLTWWELGLLRAVINLKIAEVERKLALGVADPDDLLGGMRGVKARLDRPVARLQSKVGGDV